MTTFQLSEIANQLIALELTNVIPVFITANKLRAWLASERAYELSIHYRLDNITLRHIISCQYETMFMIFINDEGNPNDIVYFPSAYTISHMSDNDQYMRYTAFLSYKGLDGFRLSVKAKANMCQDIILQYLSYNELQELSKLTHGNKLW